MLAWGPGTGLVPPSLSVNSRGGPQGTNEVIFPDEERMDAGHTKLLTGLLLSTGVTT